MDMSSGSLNYAAIDILRKIENLCGAKWFRGIIPSPATLRRCTHKVEARADEIIPIVKFCTPQGEGVKFVNMGKVIGIIHKAFGLTEIGKERSIEVAITTDGSLLAHLINLVMVGYKLIDTAAQGTHQLGNSFLTQLTPPTPSIKAATYASPHDAVGERNKRDVHSKHQINNLPFVCACPGDLSCHWKATLVGGGAKIKTRFCMNCACTSDNISTPAEVTCEPCKKKGPDTDTEAALIGSATIMNSGTIPLFKNVKHQWMSSLKSIKSKWKP
eukprot:scaffold204635_cov24-Attheya_sp.AAC.1